MKHSERRTGCPAFDESCARNLRPSNKSCVKISVIVFNIGGCPLESLELARYIVEVVEDRKAEEIILMDLRPKAIIADFFVIANGNSDRQLKALADNVREKVKEAYQTLPYAVEGNAESGWVLMDYGDVIVHLFLEEKRQFYDLEGLWRAESSVLLSIQ
jgi:ribosome-associated protein